MVDLVLDGSHCQCEPEPLCPWNVTHSCQSEVARPFATIRYHPLLCYNLVRNNYVEHRHSKSDHQRPDDVRSSYNFNAHYSQHPQSTTSPDESQRSSFHVRRKWRRNRGKSKFSVAPLLSRRHVNEAGPSNYEALPCTTSALPGGATGNWSLLSLLAVVLLKAHESAAWYYPSNWSSRG